MNFAVALDSEKIAVAWVRSPNFKLKVKRDFREEDVIKVFRQFADNLKNIRNSDNKEALSKERENTLNCAGFNLCQLLHPGEILGPSNVSFFMHYYFPIDLNGLVCSLKVLNKKILDLDFSIYFFDSTKTFVDIQNLRNGFYTKDLLLFAEDAFGEYLTKAGSPVYKKIIVLLSKAVNGIKPNEENFILEDFLDGMAEQPLNLKLNNGIHVQKIEEARHFFESFLNRYAELYKMRDVLREQQNLENEEIKKAKTRAEIQNLANSFSFQLISLGLVGCHNKIASVFEDLINEIGSCSTNTEGLFLEVIQRGSTEIVTVAKTYEVDIPLDRVAKLLREFFSFHISKDQPDVFKYFKQCYQNEIEFDRKLSYKSTSTSEIFPEKIIKSLEQDKKAHITSLNLKEEESKEVNEVLTQLFHFAANGTPSHASFELTLQKIEKMQIKFQIENLKNFLNFISFYYCKIKIEREDLLALQEDENNREMLEHCQFCATGLTQIFLGSSLFPRNIRVDENTILTIFTELLLDLGECKDEISKKVLFDSLLTQISNLIFKGEQAPELFHSKLKALIDYQLFGNLTNELITILFGTFIENDQKPVTPREGDPYLDIAFISDKKYLHQLEEILKKENGLNLSLFREFLNRALNGNQGGSIDATVFIDAILKLDPNIHKYRLIDDTFVLYIELQANRFQLVDEQKKQIVEYRNEIIKLTQQNLARYQITIENEKKAVIPVIQDQPEVMFFDLMHMEGGYYIKKLVGRINSHPAGPIMCEKLKTFAASFYEKVINRGSNMQSHLEELIKGLGSFFETSEGLKEYIPLENSLIDQFIETYFSIAQDRSILPEIKKRCTAYHGLTQRWVSVLNSLENLNPDPLKPPSSPFWVKINNYALRYFARVAPVEAPEAETTMIGGSMHQPEAGYFRTNITKTQYSYIYEQALNREFELISKDTNILKDEIIFLNNPNFSKVLSVNYQYFDLNSEEFSDDNKIVTRFKALMKEIRLNNENQNKKLMFGLNYVPALGETPEVMGKLIWKKFNNLRVLLVDAIKYEAEKRVDFEFAELYPTVDRAIYRSYPKYKSSFEKQFNYLISRFNLACIIQKKPIPLIYLPRLYARTVANDYTIFPNRIHDLLTLIIDQGYASTMQKTSEFVSRITAFAQIKPKEPQVTLKVPLVDLDVYSLTDLIQRPMFGKFKSMSQSLEARQAGVDLIMQNTVKLVESFNGISFKETFPTVQARCLLSRSLNLILTQIKEALQFKLGLHRDVADMARIKEHVMDQVLFWLDNPSKIPHLQEEEQENRKKLVEKREKLEQLMSEAQFRGLIPEFSQFVSGGGMNALSTILRGFGNGLQIANFDNSYFTNSAVFTALQENKVQNSFTIKNENFEEDLNEIINNIKVNREEIRKRETQLAEARQAFENAKAEDRTSEMNQAIEQAEIALLNEKKKNLPLELDLLFVDPHPSPSKALHTIRANNIERIIQIVMESGITAKEFTIGMDTTTSYLYDSKLNNTIHQATSQYRDLNIVTYRSCQKFDSLGSDKLSGGFLSLFSKNTELIDRFKRFKEDDPIEEFNVDGFTFMFSNFEKELNEHRSVIFKNSQATYEGINPKFIYDKNNRMKVFFDKREDPDSYYNIITFPSTLKVSELISMLNSLCLNAGIPAVYRFSFGFEVTSFDNISDLKIRIKVGYGNPETIKLFSGVLNKFYRYICAKVDQPVDPVDPLYE